MSEELERLKVASLERVLLAVMRRYPDVCEFIAQQFEEEKTLVVMTAQLLPDDDDEDDDDDDSPPEAGT
jgi:hypothetical protein